MAFLLACSVFGPVASASGSEQEAQQPPKIRLLPRDFPKCPSQPPALAIPVTPLGFTPPSSFYLGQRISLVSLDFIGEDRLLFTFRVPGLMHRGQGAENQDERQIRAVVLRLPSGAVEAETTWTIYGRNRYLWMLSDGHFLLRRGSVVEEGDASLNLTRQFHFPGQVLWIDASPSAQYLAVNSRETAEKTASATVASEEERAFGKPQIAVRILRRDSGKVLLASRTRMPVHLPINSEGYLESLRGFGLDWVLNLRPFSGGTKTIGHIKSTCEPVKDFLSEKLFLVHTCGINGEHRLLGMSLDGRFLWQDEIPEIAYFPLLPHASGGTRLAVESLWDVPSGSVLTSAREVIQGQIVRVVDTASGKQIFESAVEPVLDAGGNVAFSPSGGRLALLNSGSLQIFDLPADGAEERPVSGPQGSAVK